MSEQDIQEQIEFILDQQARLTADLRRLSEAQVNAEARMSTTEARISNLEGAMVGLVNLFGEVVKAQKTTDTTVADLGGKIEALIGRVNTLAERVDAFISTVRHYLTEKNGGGKKWS
jgi:hypothetical protein